MNKYLITASALLSAGCFVLAWQWVVTFDPASPLIPFVLVFCSGVLLRQAID